MLDLAAEVPANLHDRCWIEFKLLLKDFDSHDGFKRSVDSARQYGLDVLSRLSGSWVGVSWMRAW